MIDKKIIKNNFSKYARYYDRYATVQDCCARALINKINTDNLKEILDIGCGTGNYTKLLMNKFPKAKIRAVDISDEMIKVARNKLKDNNIEFVIADAEAMAFDKQFDLISSNAAFQWFGDFKNTLKSYKGLLNKNGVILFSLFGPLTFYELNESIKKIDKEFSDISACNFIDGKNITNILNSIFRDAEIEQKIYKERYSSVTELLETIKYTGIRGNGTKSLMTPNKLNKLENIYKESFGDITATYQVFFCKGSL